MLCLNRSEVNRDSLLLIGNKFDFVCVGERKERDQRSNFKQSVCRSSVCMSM